MLQMAHAAVIMITDWRRKEPHRSVGNGAGRSGAPRPANCGCAELGATSVRRTAPARDQSHPLPNFYLTCSEEGSTRWSTKGAGNDRRRPFPFPNSVDTKRRLAKRSTARSAITSRAPLPLAVGNLRNILCPRQKRKLATVLIAEAHERSYAPPGMVSRPLAAVPASTALASGCASPACPPIQQSGLIPC